MSQKWSRPWSHHDRGAVPRLLPCQFHDRGTTEVHNNDVNGLFLQQCGMVCTMVQWLLICADCKCVQASFQMMFMSGRLAMTHHHSLVDCSRTASIFAHDVTWHTGACNGELIASRRTMFRSQFLPQCHVSTQNHQVVIFGPPKLMICYYTFDLVFYLTLVRGEVTDPGVNMEKRESVVISN